LISTTIECSWSRSRASSKASLRRDKTVALCFGIALNIWRISSPEQGAKTLGQVDYRNRKWSKASDEKDFSFDLQAYSFIRFAISNTPRSRRCLPVDRCQRPGPFWSPHASSGRFQKSPGQYRPG